MATITFHELEPVSWFKDRRFMKSLLVELFSREQVPLGSIDFIFCNDEYLLQINREFLDHHDLTDIITFDLTGPVAPLPSSPAALGNSNDRLKAMVPKQGEIYISIERVTENASSLNLPREEELRRVMFHGCLHLCGFKDKLKADQALMRKKEDEYLRLYKRRST